MNRQNRWQQNRHRLYEDVAKECDLIVLSANRRQQRAGDSTYRFRQDSSFYYYTGLDVPGLVYVGDINGGDEWLITPKLSNIERVFDGQIDHSRLHEISGLTVMSERDGWQRLKRGLSAKTKIGVIKRLTQGAKSASPNNAHISLHRKLRRLEPRPELHDISLKVARQRAVKQQWEIESIQQAIDVTAGALQQMARKLTDYRYEYEIAADITAGFHRHNAQPAYEPIVAGGRNALTLHYVENSDSLKNDSLLLVDVGAEVNNYCADITRTYPINGKFSSRQRGVYEAVLDVQQHAISLLKPGLALAEYVESVDARMKQAISQLGLPSSQLRQLAPHGVSHGLGLDVHDPIAQNTLEPGMVLTVEPGIYIADEILGIRIEDDVLITETGSDVLSEHIERDPDQLERLSAGR